MKEAGIMKEQTRYSRLATITKLINTKHELREVLEFVTAAISEEIVQCDSVGIYLPQEDGSFRGFVGKPATINGMTLDMQVIDLEYDLLAKEVIETQKTIYIPDTSIDNRPDPRAIQAFQIKSLLALPISHENKLFGLVFLFDYGVPMNLTKLEIQSVEAYVDMAAVAIQNASNLTRKTDLLAEKQLLLDVNRDLSMCSTMNEAMDNCFFYIGKVLNNDSMGLYLLDYLVAGSMKLTYLSKKSDIAEADWLKVYDSALYDKRVKAVIQEVITSRKALLIPDVVADDRPNHELCGDSGGKGQFVLPLVSMGNVLGVIMITNLKDKMVVYSEVNQQLAQLVVDATAATLSNILYMEKQEAIIEERTLELTKKNKKLEKAVTELRRLSREKELILNSAGDGIFGLDLTGKITFYNPAAETILGYDKEDELIGQHYSVVFEENKEQEQKIVWDFLEKNYEKYNSEANFSKKDHSIIAVDYVISAIEEDNKFVGYVVTFKDITKRRQMEEEIKYHAYYDSLTNLPNRILLKDRLDEEVSYAKVHDGKLAVLFMDLDRFKTVNDTLGHSYGDLLLGDVAKRLTSCLPVGAMASRQGGDEFIILLPHIGNEVEVLKLIECIIKTFSNPFSLNGNEIYIKNSIGISLFPKNGDTAELLIKNADIAMYQAKATAGNSYRFYEAGMDTGNFESLLIENDLYKAINNDELVIYYQPQINYSTKMVVGVEALIRWNHSIEGLLPPDRFIPIAEETGLIVSIGEWVLENACKQIKQWQQQGYPLLSVAVNLSVRQFEQNDLFSVVQTILDKVGLSPEYLHLELTENQIIKNTMLTLQTMERLKAIGIQIAIDDFGTGYSSLGYLKDFPINTLKIDRSFVQNLGEKDDNAAITNTIIAMAQNLNLNVIAEGVETKEQAEFLASRSCYLMQGYYFDRPIQANEFEEKYLVNNGELAMG